MYFDLESTPDIRDQELKLGLAKVREIYENEKNVKRNISGIYYCEILKGSSII